MVQDNYSGLEIQDTEAGFKNQQQAATTSNKEAEGKIGTQNRHWPTIYLKWIARHQWLVSWLVGVQTRGTGLPVNYTVRLPTHGHQWRIVVENTVDQIVPHMVSQFMWLIMYLGSGSNHNYMALSSRLCTAVIIFKHDNHHEITSIQP